jgi:transcriptional regulator with XRE-family HTH domain
VSASFFVYLTDDVEKLNHLEMTISDDQYKFITTVLTKTGWSQTDLAHRAGLDPSTLSRFLTKTRDGRALRSSTVQRIATASGLSFGEELLHEADGLAETEAEPFLYSEDDNRTIAIKALCGQQKNVDAWVLTSRALEGLGYRPGDIVFVGLGEKPVPGDVVCAQIYDWVKGRAETIFRLYQPPALIAVTQETSLLIPYVLGDNAVTVKGVVLHTLRSRQNHKIHLTI